MYYVAQNTDVVSNVRGSRLTCHVDIISAGGLDRVHLPVRSGLSRMV